MSEISTYEAYKKKLQGLCDEHDLVYRFEHDKYPITLTIKPAGGLDAQMSLLDRAEEEGFTSSDSSIVFKYKDGVLTYKMSKTITIGDALFSKLKNLYKNLYFSWLQFFFRDLMEDERLSKFNRHLIPAIDDGDDQETEGVDIPEGAEPLETIDQADEVVEEGDNLPDSQYADMDEADAIEMAIKLVRSMGRASASMLQREMGISYGFASEILDQLEEEGVVGPFDGENPREVLPADQPEDGDNG